jgi:hypothetical protein
MPNPRKARRVRPRKRFTLRLASRVRGDGR